MTIVDIFIIEHIFLPEFERCSCKFLQEILTDQKKVLYDHEIPSSRPPTFPELSMKLMIPRI